jgi:hypothetical protein
VRPEVAHRRGEAGRPDSGGATVGHGGAGDSDDVRESWSWSCSPTAVELEIGGEPDGGGAGVP